MGVRQYKPTSAGRRHGSVSDFAECTHPRKNNPEKSLLVPNKKKGGRNNQGVVTVRFRGGGHKQMYRIIDFKRNKYDGVQATVVQVEYDPNRSARIALIEYKDAAKTRTYILAPQGLKAGDAVMSGLQAEPRPGNCLPLSKIPLGLTIHNIEMQPGRGGQICRSAGCSATLTARDESHGWAQVTLPSGEVRRVPSHCRASIGAMSNPDHMNISLGKAGRKRWMGASRISAVRRRTPSTIRWVAVKDAARADGIPVRHPASWPRAARQGRSGSLRIRPSCAVESAVRSRILADGNVAEVARLPLGIRRGSLATSAT